MVTKYRSHITYIVLGLLIILGSLTPSLAKAPHPVTPRPVKGTPVTPSATATFVPKFTATSTNVFVPNTPTDTSVPVDTATPTDVVISTATDTSVPTATFTATHLPPNTPTVVGTISPYPSAPLCPDETHDTSEFHTLWDENRGCHYDHEHGQNPFAPNIAAAFPGFNLRSLLGLVEVGHTNPSGPMENTHKHGGFKWTVSLAPNYLPAVTTCVPGFEAAVNCVTAAVVQYHQFGDANMELEVRDGQRIHSANALIRMGPLADPGYMYTVQHIEYGEICASYQGAVVPYPQNFIPLWDCAFGPYWTTPCVGSFTNIRASNCALSYEDIVGDADSIVTSKPTDNTIPVGVRPPGSTLFKLLWRARDAYQALDATGSLEYPLTYLWLCSNDSGVTFDPTACYYNNSTGRVHEVGGNIPAEWDNLEGFDTDPRVGRITATGFTTRFGTLNLSCASAGGDCFPVKLVNAYVGTYGGTLSATKISNTTPTSNPERDIYFCNGIVCTETSFGAVPSGWIGPSN